MWGLRGRTHGAKLEIAFSGRPATARRAHQLAGASVYCVYFSLVLIVFVAVQKFSNHQVVANQSPEKSPTPATAPGEHATALGPAPMPAAQHRSERCHDVRKLPRHRAPLESHRVGHLPEGCRGADSSRRQQLKFTNDVTALAARRMTNQPIFRLAVVALRGAPPTLAFAKVCMSGTPWARWLEAQGHLAGKNPKNRLPCCGRGHLGSFWSCPSRGSRGATNGQSLLGSKFFTDSKRHSPRPPRPLHASACLCMPLPKASTSRSKLPLSQTFLLNPAYARTPKLLTFGNKQTHRGGKPMGWGGRSCLLPRENHRKPNASLTHQT